MAKQLSQDLPENISMLDVFGDSEESTIDASTDILPDDETTEETEEETTEETTEETNEEEQGNEKGNDIMAELDEAINDNGKTIEDSQEKTEEMKGTIEEAKAALENDDTDSAEKLIDDLYTQVIEYSTKVDTLSAKNDILQNKVMELNSSNTDYELQLAQNVGKSNDPKMLVLNRMYDGAVSGEEYSKDKVISVLEDMYYGLTGQSYEDKKVNDVSDSNAQDIVFNENTQPAISEVNNEKEDLNDISSIF